MKLLLVLLMCVWAVAFASLGTVNHPQNAVKALEDDELDALVPAASATHKAVASGPWNTPSTWKNRRIPDKNAVVLIPQDVVVLYNANATVSRIRVAGTLKFAVAQQLRLFVDTIIVMESGSFVMGTPESPVTGSIDVVFTSAEINKAADPTQLGKGLISIGRTSIYGLRKTSWLALAKAPRKGDNELLLSSIPLNWSAGDIIVLAGTASSNSTEEFQIRKIADRTVTIFPAVRSTHGLVDSSVLKSYYGRAPPGDPFRLYVGNLGRTIRFRSQATRIPLRGHVMFMHNYDTNVYFAGFYDLGRTNKAIVVDDVQLDERGQPVPGTGTNVRGRYPLHAHRWNPDVRGGAPPVLGSFVGNAIAHGPGWGIVSHSSGVRVADNVVYDILGAAIVSEVGDETGAFVSNLAVRAKGDGSLDDFVRRRVSNDFGFSGHGFWLHSPQVNVTNNVVADVASFAAVLYPFAYEVENGSIVDFPSSWLQRREDAGGATSLAVTRVPLGGVGNNVFYNVRWGFALYGYNPLVPAKFGAMTIINPNVGCLDTTYSNFFTFANMRCVQYPAKNGAPAIDIDGAIEVNWINNYIVGFETGVIASYGGNGKISDGFLNNYRNIIINSQYQWSQQSGALTADGKREVTIDSVAFGKLRADLGPSPANVTVDHSISSIFIHSWFGVNQFLFRRRPSEDFVQLYAPEMSPLFVVTGSPTSVDASQIPDIDGKTNVQLSNAYNFTTGGFLTPTSTTRYPDILGAVVGQRTKPRDTPARKVVINEKDNMREVIVELPGTPDVTLAREVRASALKTNQYNLMFFNFEGRKRWAIVYVNE